MCLESPVTPTPVQTLLPPLAPNYKIQAEEKMFSDGHFG
jgi:hypothetical protein